MQLLKKKTNIDFMSVAFPAMVLSVVLIVLSIVCLFVRGLNFGLDFTGGTLIEIHYSTPPAMADVRKNLEAADLSDAVVQTFGTASDIVVRIPPRSAEESNAEISTTVLNALQKDVKGEVSVRRVEFVGPQVGEDLTEQGILAVIYAMVGIFIYVMFRFQWRFSAGAVYALLHDAVICMGMVSLFQVEFDLTVVAAILAVIGYSLNDTIVIFDRIRENFPKMLKSQPREVINASVNQTLERTIMMSFTVLLVLVALYVYGGQVLHAFSYTLIVGVVVGSYSTIYVASASVLYLGVSKYDLLKVEKEGAEVKPRS